MTDTAMIDGEPVTAADEGHAVMTTATAATTPTTTSSVGGDRAPEPLIDLLDAGVVADAIRAAGCGVTPVTQDGVVHLHSACHGVGFQVLWGNPVPPAEPGGEGRWADLTLSCPLRVQGGSLPSTLESEWHRAKRFARVSRHGDHVVLEMDIVAAGGIARANLDIQLRLWTQMMGQFFGFLRNYRAEGDAAAVTTPAA